MKSDSILQQKVLQLQQYFPLSIKKKKSERSFFSIVDDKQGITLYYSDELIGFYALRKVEEACKLNESSIFSEVYPITEVRAFWPLYSLIEDEDFITIASLGFNMLVIEESQFAALKQAKEWGFKILYKPSLPKEWEEITPWREDYQTKLHHLFEERQFDAIYWESPYFLKTPYKQMIQRHKLFSDLLEKEIMELEKKAPLFYFIPDQKRYEISKLEQLKNSSFTPLKASQVQEQILEGILGPCLQRDFSHFVWKSKSRPKIGEFNETEHYIIGKKLMERSEDPLKDWLTIYQKDAEEIYTWYTELSFYYKLLRSGTKKEDLIPRFLKLEKEVEEKKKQRLDSGKIKIFEEALLFLRQMRE